MQRVQLWGQWGQETRVLALLWGLRGPVPRSLASQRRGSPDISLATQLDDGAASRLIPGLLLPHPLPGLGPEFWTPSQ